MRRVVVDFFICKEGVKPEKRGFQPMRKKLGEKFGVVFSLTVVVTDTELKQGGKKPGLMPNFCERRRIFPKIGGEVKKGMRISDLKTV